MLDTFLDVEDLEAVLDSLKNAGFQARVRTKPMRSSDTAFLFSKIVEKSFQIDPSLSESNLEFCLIHSISREQNGHRIEYNEGGHFLFLRGTDVMANEKIQNTLTSFMSINENGK